MSHSRTYMLGAAMVLLTFATAAIAEDGLLPFTRRRVSIERDKQGRSVGLRLYSPTLEDLQSLRLERSALKKISVDGATAATAEPLAKLLQQPSIETVFATDCDFDNEHFQLDPKQLPNLRHLWLKDCKLGNETLKNLAGFKKLRALDITRPKFAAGVSVDYSQLQHCPEIDSIIIRDSQLTDCRWVSQLPKLSRLDLPSSPIGDDSLAEIVKLKHLDSLDLRGTRITSEGLKQLPADIAKSHLDFGSRPLSHEAVRATLTATQASYICVHGCDLKGMDFSFLSQNSTIEWLDLGDNNLGPRELLSIPIDASMSTLNLRASVLDDDAIAHLAKMKSVEELYLGDTKVTTAQLCTLARGATIAQIVCFDCKLDPDVHQRVSDATNRIVKVVTDFPDPRSQLIGPAPGVRLIPLYGTSPR